MDPICREDRGRVQTILHKATQFQCQGLVIEEVRRQEAATRCAKAVSQAKQGQWMNKEGVEKRKFSWKELWDMEAILS